MIELPWPPSANTYYRNIAGKTLISAKGRAYRDEVMDRCLEQRVRKDSRRLRVTITAFPPDRRRRDLDNMLKGLLDALTHGGAWDDDSQIDDLRIVRGPVTADGCVSVSIEGVSA